MIRTVLFVYIATMQLPLMLCDYGVMRVHSDDSDWKSHFCMVYNPAFHSLPAVANQAATYKLTDLSATDGCDLSDYTPAIVNGTVVIVDIANCSSVTKAYLAKYAGARGIIMASDVLMIPSTQHNYVDVDYRNITIPVASTLWSYIRLIQTNSHGGGLSVLLYSPVFSKFDANIFMFFFLSVLVIVVGGFWSGTTKYEKIMAQCKYPDEIASDEQAASSSTRPGAEGDRAYEKNTGMDGSVDIPLKTMAVATDKRGECETANKNENKNDELGDIPLKSITASTYGSAVSEGACLEEKEDEAVDIPFQTATTSADACSQVDGADEEKEKEKDGSVFSLKTVIVFVVSASTFLVLLYFFYDYMVYVTIVLFALSGAGCLYSCINAWVWGKLVPWSTRIPANRIPLFRGRPQYRNIILGLLCLGVGIFWFVERHASYAWIIQDFLGVVCCISFIKSVTIPNFKLCTILLVCMFLYDIFFVFVTPTFVTPFISKKGNSIMEKVATGGDSKTNERVPWVFMSPPFIPNEIYSCSQFPFSVLGFGDAVIPGLLVAHNYAFDLLVHSKKVYYIATIISYIVGLSITYVVLALMETGQPALLYLVPCTLLTTFAIGCIRGEVCLLWRGASVITDQTKPADSESGVDNNASAVHASASYVDSVPTCSASEDENRHLFEGDQRRLVEK